MSRNDELLEAFATELRVRRNRIGISQEELARLANVNRTYIAKLELARNQPTLTVLHDLANALSNDLPDLIKGVFERYKHKQAQSSDVSLLRKTSIPSADSKFDSPLPDSSQIVAISPDPGKK